MSHKQLKRYVRQEGPPRKLRTRKCRINSRKIKPAVCFRERGLREINKNTQVYFSNALRKCSSGIFFIVVERKKEREREREREKLRREFSPQCWNMRWTRRGSSTSDKEGKERKEREIFSQSLTIKSIKSSKWRRKKERKKEKGSYLLKVETWDGQKPAEKKKERKTRLKKRKGEREKEREEELSSSMVKLGRTKKRKRKEFVKSVEEESWIERKVKWKKVGKERRENSEMNNFF